MTWMRLSARIGPEPGTREPAIGEFITLFAAEGPVTGLAPASDADASGIGQAQNP